MVRDGVWGAERVRVGDGLRAPGERRAVHEQRCVRGQHCRGTVRS